MSTTELSKEKQLLKSSDNDVMEQVICHLGGMGAYQRWMVLMMLPIGFLFSFLYSAQMFIAATPQQHWCRVPELMHLDVELRRNLSIPGASSGPDWDRCFMYAANWSYVLANMTPPDASTPKVPCQDGWEFLYEDIPYPTVVSEREWVCDKSSYAPTAQAVFFIGSLLGGGLFGWIGDRYGRVPSFMGANIVGCVGGIASVFTVGFVDFMMCRFLVGMANDAGFMMMYILVLEYVGPKQRSWVGNMALGICFGVGGMILPALALLLKDWRRLLIVTSLPMLFVIGAPWVIPESARWLASTGKLNRALKVLKKFERVNKTKIPDDILQQFITSANKTSETDESMSALIRSARIRNSVVCLILVNILASIIIDGIMRMSESIGDSFFVTFALSSLVEIPALSLVALVLDRLGRRFLASFTVGISGFLSLVCAITPKGVPQLVVALMIRFAVNMSLGVLVQQGTELLPTGLRALGNSIIHMTVFVATTFSPFVVYSGKLWRNLPLVILGVMGLLACGIALLLPETKGQPMPQTIADAEKLIRENMLCGKLENEDQETEYQEVVSLENKNAKIFE